MFSLLGLFQKLPCPDRNNCKRPRCLFSHRPDASETLSLSIPLDGPKTAPTPGPSTSAGETKSTVPAKRPALSQADPAWRPGSTSNGNAALEPPRKLQKTGLGNKPVAVPTASTTSTGVPILKVNAAQSQVAIPVRQAMIKTLYEHFLVLYQNILPSNPTLASEHALKQEEEVYKKSTKLTYRNAVISSVASLKRRPVPDKVSHPSVGTEQDLVERAEKRKSLESLQLTREYLEPLMLSLDDMQKWGYITEIPEGPGGDKPSEEGNTMKCERCRQQFLVKRLELADECTFHWGRPYSKQVNGEKMRIYSCCGKPTADSEGCHKGPHVFYETKPEDLHARHAFSHTRPRNSSDSGPSSKDTALDVVALDCEMIYTTGGMSVARVSVVDGSGAEVFDQLVRMDEGVHVIDYNTRFSGITPEEYAKAVLPLSSIRQSLDAFINSETIIAGHALENDLKTLRMIHHRCVDTVALFPHPAGSPFRRALRDLVKEHLGQIIQAGGATVGHSSVEDSIATLDLVRWYVLNKGTTKPAVKSKATSNNSKKPA
ncbi:ribonuclease H-like protein [Neolentinus lepideus HHB14362 ss-1]|uniref:Ribonuclease H-like protein n=1 Tax=Neolentinus lepideus HHB14362 ss-1 TaxID=1314782 RepID=A0A165P0K3_9AGAM|nr:ribonuclease H-like protein [Neolentinus lepideus HHB14362 ss-1]